MAVCQGPHAAILYRSAEGRPKFLHLAWHRVLRDEGFAGQEQEFVSVEPNLERDDRVALAAYCRRIALANMARRAIPYNLRYEPGTTFDPDTGDFLLPEGATGLSCATFVVQVFRSAGLPILDASTWPPARPKDRERQRTLIEWLRDYPDPRHRDPIQADRLEAEVGCPRIRPEEVAGACLEDEIPAGFEQCEPNGCFLIGLVEAGAQGLTLVLRL